MCWVSINVRYIQTSQFHLIAIIIPLLPLQLLQLNLLFLEQPLLLLYHPNHLLLSWNLLEEILSRTLWVAVVTRRLETRLRLDVCVAWKVVDYAGLGLDAGWGTLVIYWITIPCFRRHLFNSCRRAASLFSCGFLLLIIPRVLAHLYPHAWRHILPRLRLLAHVCIESLTATFGVGLVIASKFCLRNND